jgi:Rad3-related DNA helicase
MSDAFPDPDAIPDDPRDAFWTSHVPDPWPDWVTGFRPWQLEATRQVVDAYARGVDAVCLDAPTGAGKTIIGEMVRRCCPEEWRATYLCHSINLQHQFQADFPYATVLKGRSNYPTEIGPPWVTAADCTGRGCAWCVDACPYRVAKGRALGSRLCIANTAYWLHEVNHVREGLRGRELLIVDEADVLESALMGFVEFKVTREMAKRAGVAMVKKGAHAPTVAAWCLELADGLKVWAQRNLKSKDVKVVRQAMAAQRLGARALVFAREVADEGTGGKWIREYVEKGWDEGAGLWKAVTVGGEGGGKVWRWVGGGLGDWDAGGGERLVSGKILAMSATLISAREWAESNGVEDAGLSWETVTVPSPFPVANRPIWAVPVADMGYKTWQRDVGDLCLAIDVTLDKHPYDKVLIHSTSYQVAREIGAWLGAGGDGRDKRSGRTSSHVVITHGNGKGERDAAIERYVQTKGPAVIVSPSLDRGVDLPGDLCRVQIIAKVPFASLGDRQIAERLRTPGGQAWYTTNTARTIVQMTGRGVRSADDHATTYIFDRQFNKWYGQARRILPEWWTDAVKAGKVTDFRPR